MLTAWDDLLSGVVAEIKWNERRPDFTIGREVKLVTLRSTENGMIEGSFEHPAFPGEGSITIEFSKEGYGEVLPLLPYLPNQCCERVGHVGPVQPEYILKRVFLESDVARIAALDQKDRAHELKEKMAGVLKDASLARALFKMDHTFRPVLRDLVHDPAVQTEAIRLLAFLGLPDELQKIYAHMPTFHEDARWIFGNWRRGPPRLLQNIANGTSMVLSQEVCIGR